MDFSEALRVVKDGGKVQRAIWARRPVEVWPGAYVKLAEMPANFDPPVQLVVGYPGSDVLRPFAGAQWDILSDDWEIADEDERQAGSAENEQERQSQAAVQGD